MLLFPNAKINLGLNVVERRPDGYHNLETVFYPVGIHDVLEVNISDSLPPKTCCLTIEGVEIAGDVQDNLICRAYRILAADFDVPSVNAHLSKNIPTGAGLGGGSADAAYMLKAINEIAGLGLTSLQLQDYAARLGADCAFFIDNTPVYATGIGNVFHPLTMTSLAGYQLVLVKPDVFVSTKDAYSLVKPHPAIENLPDLVSLPVSEWKDRVVNDFEASVFPQFPIIEEVKNKLYSLGAEYSCMSGSGASVFALFANPIADIALHFPGMFTYSEKVMSAPMISQRQQIVTAYLEEHHIPFTCYNHPEGKTIEDAKRWWKDDGSIHCKNIFMRNHKGNKHYLICFHCDHDLDIHDLEARLKATLQAQGLPSCGKLSFASPERMMKYLGLEPGSVSPFGLINDTEHHVHLFLDSCLQHAETLSFHPNDCRGTIVIARQDFERYLSLVGNAYEYLTLY